MRAMLLLVLLTTSWSAQQSAVAASTKSTPPANWLTTQSAAATPTAGVDKKQSVASKPVTAKQQKGLLSERLPGGMGMSFSQFANMFLVCSRIHLDYGVGLVTSSKEISGTMLRSPFPRFYKPTLQELLDAIALQTFSDWKYDPSSKYFKSDVRIDAPVEGLACSPGCRSERPETGQSQPLRCIVL